MCGTVDRLVAGFDTIAFVALECTFRCDTPMSFPRLLLISLSPFALVSLCMPRFSSCIALSSPIPLFPPLVVVTLSGGTRVDNAVEGRTSRGALL